MTDQQPDPQQPDPQQPASPYGNPAPEASEVTQATPVTPPTQETPVSSPYAAPSYQPYGQSAPSYDQGQPYAAPQQHAQPQQPQPYAAPQQYGQPQQPSYGSTAPDYGQPQQYAQPAYDAQQQYAQPQQQYAQPQQYGQQYGAPVYGAAGYGQGQPTAPSQPLSLQARMPAIGLVVASLLAGIGAFLTWAKLTMTIPLLSNGAITMSANGIGGVKIGLPSDSAELREFADRASDSSGVTIGWIVVVVAVLVLVLAALRLLGKLSLPVAIAGIVGGLIVTGIAIYELVDISSSLDEFKSAGVGLQASVDPGIGLWLCLVGGVLMLGTGVLAAIHRS